MSVGSESIGSSCAEQAKGTGPIRVPVALAVSSIGFLGLALLAASSVEAATVTIVEPADLVHFQTETIPIAINVTDFLLVEPGKTGPGPGGWYQVLLDGVSKKFDYRPDTWLACVPEGNASHTIEVRLIDYNGVPTPDADTVSVFVDPGSPGLCATALGPGPGSTNAWYTCKVLFDLTSSDVNIVPPPSAGPSDAHWDVSVTDVQPPNAAGIAHVDKTANHVGIGTNKPLTQQAGFFLVTDHTYTFNFWLSHNDPAHTPITPPVWDRITGTIVSTLVGDPPMLKGCMELHLGWPVPSMNQVSLTPVDPYFWYAPSVAIDVRPGNFTLDAVAIGGANVAGRGHYRAWLDGVLIANRTDPIILLTGLSDGYHVLFVELVNNDESLLSQRVFESIEWMNLPHVPELDIQVPAPASTLPPGDLTITVFAQNFTIDSAAAGQAPQPWRGHYHVFLDGVYHGAGMGSTYTLANLPAGAHVITVRPVNNDNTDIPGATGDSLAVDVVTPPWVVPWIPIITILIICGAGAGSYVWCKRRKRMLSGPLPGP